MQSFQGGFEGCSCRTIGSRLFKSERDGRQNTESGRLCEALKTVDGLFVSVPMFPH